MRDWLQALAATRFQVIKTRRQTTVLYYRELLQLMRALKQVGARNMNAGRPKALAGRERLQTLQRVYEKFRQQRGLPATYDVYFWILLQPCR